MSDDERPKDMETDPELWGIYGPAAMRLSNISRLPLAEWKPSIMEGSRLHGDARACVGRFGAEAAFATWSADELLVGVVACLGTKAPSELLIAASACAKGGADPKSRAMLEAALALVKAARPSKEVS